MLKEQAGPQTERATQQTERVTVLKEHHIRLTGNYGLLMVAHMKLLERQSTKRQRTSLVVFLSLMMTPTPIQTLTQIQIPIQTPTPIPIPIQTPTQIRMMTVRYLELEEVMRLFWEQEEVPSMRFLVRDVDLRPVMAWQ